MSAEVAEQPKELEVKLENLSIKDDKPEKDHIDDCENSTNDDVDQNDESDDDSRKLFVGGLSWETSESDLREYFSQWGKVTQSIIKMDRVTGCSRGFGFVTMESEDCVSNVLEITEHKLKGKKIDPKKAKPSREPLKKIFVGGIDPDITQDQIMEYFSQFGKIESMDLPYDTTRGKRKNYIFVCFSTGTAAKRAIAKERQEILGKICDVRLAVTREQANRQKILKNFYGSWNDQLYGYTGGYSYPDFMNSFNIDPYALYLGYDLYGNNPNNPNAATAAVQNAFAQYRNASTARVLPTNATSNGPHSQQGPGAINPYSRTNHATTPNANPTVASIAAAAAANFANRLMSVQQQAAMHHHHSQQPQHHSHHNNSSAPSSQQNQPQAPSQPPQHSHYMHHPHPLMNGNSAPDANSVRGVLKEHDFRYTPEPFNSP